MASLKSHLASLLIPLTQQKYLGFSLMSDSYPSVHQCPTASFYGFKFVILDFVLYLNWVKIQHQPYFCFACLKALQKDLLLLANTPATLPESIIVTPQNPPTAYLSKLLSANLSQIVHHFYHFGAELDLH